MSQTYHDVQKGYHSNMKILECSLASYHTTQDEEKERSV